MFLALVLSGIILILSLLYIKFTFSCKYKLDNYHVVITGGSSGIGKCCAKEFLRLGASVTLIARNVRKLTQVKKELEKLIDDTPLNHSQKIQIFSVDLANVQNQDLNEIVGEIEIGGGPIDILVNCAGTSMAKAMIDTPFEEYKRMMDVNYFGSVRMTKSVLNTMTKIKSTDKMRRIVFVSSQAGLIGLYGYTAYSASKFALRGLAEALSMELKVHNIAVTVNCPPDTDTPGFEEENKDKPEETRLISEAAGLFKPEEVAENLIQDCFNGTFLSSIGMDGWILKTVTCGMSRSSLMEILVQIITIGPLRFIGWSYIIYFDYIVKNCNKKRK